MRKIARMTVVSIAIVAAFYATIAVLGLLAGANGCDICPSSYLDGS